MNPSMPNMVKIGLSGDSSEVRAAKLSANTAVPEDFIVVYDELVTDCERIERRLHAAFRDYRVNSRREFFRIPVKVAIKSLQREAEPYRVSTESASRAEVLPQLVARFGDWLLPDLRSVALVRLEEVCLLETIRAPHDSQYRDRVIEQTDLSFIFDRDDSQYFNPEDSLEVNVMKLLSDFDDVSYFNTLPLFTDNSRASFSERDTLENPRGKFDNSDYAEDPPF